MLAIQVLIGDPHQQSREGLKRLLADEVFDVIGATISPEGALADIQGGARPHLLVLVLENSGESFETTTLQQSSAIVPECKVVLIANTISPTLLARVSGSGANALLRNDMSREAFTCSLHLVMLGQEIFPASFTIQPINLDDSARDAAKNAKFQSGGRASDHESRVLHYLLSGHSNKMIARALAISETAVKVHVKAVLRKAQRAQSFRKRDLDRCKWFF
jgi:two-component system nitrate/nitrite response regulator NarL